MKPFFTCIILILAVLASAGCRSIRRIGESRQSIAARRLSGQGFSAMHNDQWGDAETLFASALEVSSTDDRAHWGLAESLWQRNEADLAIRHMEQAVRLSAGDPKRVQRLGRMYLEVGRLEEAQQQSLTALATNRGSAEVWALRGDCLRAAGQLPRALAAYHRALAIQPDFPEVQLQAAEIYHQEKRYGRLLATLDRLQDGLGPDATPPRADVLQGIAMRQVGRFDEAQKSLVRAVQKNPSDATPHLELASLLLEQGDTEQAKQELAIALSVDPHSLDNNGWADHFRRQQERLAREQQIVGDAEQLR
ncbi:tetratricopeptide repeat protein [Novipirellula artificiosorum]|uniref:Cellulose synthase subunit BcsC n=1 Tax=Novipirellula artificiosorum TaxID=2528016 RepID=A0A5C6E070_9BACT|nr:tetratricopeptide repeat protein [Novipirellula artificiosorum]TWU42115.1 cellulose synthase subunit BcsC [Novipirellula artificiosorum]